MQFLLFYDYAADYLQRRAEFRNAHLELAWASQARGEMILGGALDDPLDAAVMLFQCESPEVIAAFVNADPYVRNGLVTQWRIRRWHTVVGDQAVQPVRPD